MEDDRECPLPRILTFAEQEHRDGEHEEADRFLRGSARQEEEAAEEREKKTCDKHAETTDGRLHSEQRRDEDGGASEERQAQLDMDQGREASHLRCGGPQERKAGQLLIVTVRVGRIDSPCPARRDVARNPRQREPVDAERKGAEGEGHKPRAEGEAEEAGHDRPVRPQPRRIASKDRGGSTATVSRMDSVGRRRRVPRRSTSAEPIDTATRRKTMNANVTTSNTTGT